MREAATAKATKALARLREHTDALVVFFSGGKESIVLLSLATQVFPRVVAAHMYFLRGLRCVEAPVEFFARKFGAELLYVPHWLTIQSLHDGMYQHVITYDGPALKLTDIELLVRHRAGIEWACYGYKKTDSLHRRGMLSEIQNRPEGRGDPIDFKHKRVMPVADWSEREVHAHLRRLKVQAAPVRLYRVGSQNGGVGLEPEVLALMKERYPDDYERIKAVFPQVDVLVYRWQRQDFARQHRRANALPNRRGGASPTQ